MKLEDYLNSINNCSDESLTRDFGIYDSWPIFLNTNFKTFTAILDSKGYVLTDVNPLVGKSNSRFDNPSRTVKLQVFDWITTFYTQGTDSDKLQQENDYNVSILLHTYHAKAKYLPTDLRSIVDVINDLSTILIDNKISACMPKTVSWHMHEFKDYSKIVYYHPEL